MKSLQIVIVLWFFACPHNPSAGQSKPLSLIQTIERRQTADKVFDYLAVDPITKRLLVRSQSSKAVLVIDIPSGKVVHEIRGIDKPESILYRPDINRIYVTDSVGRGLKVFDGLSYDNLSSLRLKANAYSIAYDGATQVLYVNNARRD